MSIRPGGVSPPHPGSYVQATWVARSTLYPDRMEFRVFAGVPAEDVRALLALSRRRSFAREEIVFHHGDVADALHLVTKGRFAVRVVTPLGQSAMLAVRGPG